MKYHRCKQIILKNITVVDALKVSKSVRKLGYHPNKDYTFNIVELHTSTIIDVKISVYNNIMLNDSRVKSILIGYLI